MYANYHHLLELIINWNVNYAPIIKVRYGRQRKPWPTKLWLLPVATTDAHITLYLMCNTDARQYSTATHPLTIKLVDYRPNDEHTQLAPHLVTGAFHTLKTNIRESDEYDQKRPYAIVSDQPASVIDQAKQKLLELDRLITTFQKQHPLDLTAPKTPSYVKLRLIIQQHFGDSPITLILNDPTDARYHRNIDQENPTELNLTQWLLEHIVPHTAQLMMNQYPIQPFNQHDLDNYLPMTPNFKTYGVYLAKPASWLAKKQLHAQTSDAKAKKRLATDKQLAYAKNVIDEQYNAEKWLGPKLVDQVMRANHTTSYHPIYVYQLTPIFDKTDKSLGLTLKQADLLTQLDPTYQRSDGARKLSALSKHDGKELIAKLINSSSQSPKGPDSNG